MGIYGPAGSGKTFTSLLIAEGLADATGKRVAYVDTERGTDFYCQAVASRPVHPEAFDFDALYTRSVVDILDAVGGLDTKTYGVVVLDSVTHIWEACKAAYSGKTTRVGTIPMHAWSKIKKPYRDLIARLLSSPMHVLILGRQGNVFEEDEATGEMKKTGVTMKAEGETAYEPHILLRMEAPQAKPGELPTVTCTVEKDRTGVLQGQIFKNPTFDALCKPLLPLLGVEQGSIPTDDETAAHDAERIAADDEAKERASADKLRRMKAKFEAADTADEVEAVSKEVTAAFKKDMTTEHVKELRAAYQAASERVK